MPPETLHELDAPAVRAWAAAGLDGLAAAREEIDDLNVYPVPDGDTGTNLHLTMEAAVDSMSDSMRDGDGAGPAAVLGALARGALLGARGNSGVILSQVLRGLADALGDGPATGEAFAKALAHAADAAYSAVAQPVEGTMLTVTRAAADAATSGPDLSGVVRAAAAAARTALARTPDQLEVLQLAGVVDAGGRGVCVLLDALERVVTGAAVQAAVTPPRGRRAQPRGRPPRYHGPAYEVMYLLEAPAAAIPGLRDELTPLGDSLFVVGGEPTWNVHVHVDDAGAAIEAGLAAGRPHRIKVTSLSDAALTSGDVVPDGRAVVSVVAGRGLGTLFEAAGATVVPGGPGARASAAEVLDGLHRARRRDLIVLPNDQDSLAVAEVAATQARDEGLRVAVVPTTASVQALAALAVHDEARRFEDDVVAMTAAAAHCRHGGVTVASRDAVTTAGVCHQGDVLGIVDGDFVLIGHALDVVAVELVDRLLGSGGELVTLVTGADARPGLAESVVEHLRRSRPEVDTAVYAGGQPRYPLLFGVE